MVIVFCLCCRVNVNASFSWFDSLSLRYQNNHIVTAGTAVGRLLNDVAVCSLVIGIHSS